MVVMILLVTMMMVMMVDFSFLIVMVRHKVMDQR